MNDATNEVLQYNEEAYRALGHGAQRQYPNEELCRFMGRNLFPIARENRRGVRIFELGCGSASNLWMIAREGFSAFGIDLSPSALPLAQQTLENYGVMAELHVGDMRPSGGGGVSLIPQDISTQSSMYFRQTASIRPTSTA